MDILYQLPYQLTYTMERNINKQTIIFADILLVSIQDIFKR